MEQIALGEYEQFDSRQKAYEAELADQQDEKELRQIEDQIKNRETGQDK